MKIARVFPRVTNATPLDDLSFSDVPGMFPPEVDEVHVSVTFTYDIPRAEYLAKQWQGVAPVKIGGPAMNDPGGRFVPGKYLKKGYLLTSRGCPNDCWFCSVPKREGDIRELAILNGTNILDSNLLACSDQHIKDVFRMLKQQSGKKEFTGGFEAKILKPWHVELLADLKPSQVFFAYDTPDDYKHLVKASAILKGVSKHSLRCYVLCGWKKDKLYLAEKRMRDTFKLGFIPQAMVYRDKNGLRDTKWMKFARAWSRPAIVKSIMKSSEHN